MSKAVVHGDTVYLAGQVADKAAGKSVAEQTAEILGIIDGLLAEIRKILRTQGQHNIALVGAGRLGQAIASSPIL